MTSRKSTFGLRNPKKYCNQTVKLRQCPKKPESHRPRSSRNHRLNVSDLVYKFLGDVATVNAERRQRNNARNNFQRVHVRNSGQKNRRPNDRKRNVNEMSGISQCMESEFRTKFSPSKIRGEKGITDCLPDIEDYVKAVHKCMRMVDIDMISKQRAERYICKALTFGVDAGFLIPNDSSGYLYRVSSSLKRARNTT